jgi:PhzF family phenazine biosynthesis protein
MKQKIYQVDAFTNRIFQGNPAAVCPLESWLSDELLQNIAMENNLSETAFYVKQGNKFQIRWFTPSCEVDLCGHATLATAYVLFSFENFNEKVLRFDSLRSGELTVTKNGELLTLNFPSDVPVETEMTDEIRKCFNIEPKQVFKGKTDYLLVFDNENEIKTITPRLDIISGVDCRGIIVTARGKDVDFVSRFFGPQSGVDEDPVTGSAHTTLTPYWAKQLGKLYLSAVQLSKRRGSLQCRLLDERVEISGECRLYMTGEININEIR